MKLRWPWRKASTTPPLFTADQILQAIESVVGDDQCEVWGMENAHRRFRGRSRDMQEKLSLVYRLAHSGQQSHSCYRVHDGWRLLVAPLLRDESEPQMKKGVFR